MHPVGRRPQLYGIERTANKPDTAPANATAIHQPPSTIPTNGNRHAYITTNPIFRRDQRGGGLSTPAYCTK
jgi:hypothetical protein